VPTRLLYGFHFFIYGNLGKMVLISALIFGFLIRERLAELAKLPKAKTQIPLIILSFILIPFFFMFAKMLLLEKAFTTNLSLSLLVHGILILIPAVLLLGIFSFKFITSFARRFWRELLACAVISIGFDVGIFQAWKLWPFFSGGVLASTKFLLSLTFPHVVHIPPYTLVVNSFAVSILQSCSGLDSLFMFTALYVLIGVLDYKKLNITKLLITYPFATLGMYLVNIIRVYLLILIGVLISPQLALNLFHTYAGMILFIIYFTLFWMKAYKWLLRKKV